MADRETPPEMAVLHTIGTNQEFRQYMKTLFTQFLRIRKQYEEEHQVLKRANEHYETLWNLLVNQLGFHDTAAVKRLSNVHITASEMEGLLNNLLQNNPAANDKLAVFNAKGEVKTIDTLDNAATTMEKNIKHIGYMSNFVKLTETMRRPLLQRFTTPESLDELKDAVDDS